MNNYVVTISAAPITVNKAVNYQNKNVLNGVLSISAAPNYAISAVNITAMAVSGLSTSLTNTVCGLSAVPYTIYWNGATATSTSTTWTMTALNAGPRDNTEVKFRVLATTSGVMSARANGAAALTASQLNASDWYTLTANGMFWLWTTEANHARLYTEGQI